MSRCRFMLFVAAVFFLGRCSAAPAQSACPECSELAFQEVSTLLKQAAFEQKPGSAPGLISLPSVVAVAGFSARQGGERAPQLSLAARYWLEYLQPADYCPVIEEDLPDASAFVWRGNTSICIKQSGAYFLGSKELQNWGYDAARNAVIAVYSDGIVSMHRLPGFEIVRSAQFAELAAPKKGAVSRWIFLMDASDGYQLGSSRQSYILSPAGKAGFELVSCSDCDIAQGKSQRAGCRPSGLDDCRPLGRLIGVTGNGNPPYFDTFPSPAKPRNLWSVDSIPSSSRCRPAAPSSQDPVNPIKPPLDLLAIDDSVSLSYVGGVLLLNDKRAPNGTRWGYRLLAFDEDPVHGAAMSPDKRIIAVFGKHMVQLFSSEGLPLSLTELPLASDSRLSKLQQNSATGNGAGSNLRIETMVVSDNGAVSVDACGVVVVRHAPQPETVLDSLDHWTGISTKDGRTPVTVLPYAPAKTDNPRQ